MGSSPLFLNCSVARRRQEFVGWLDRDRRGRLKPTYRVQSGHDLARTGRTRPNRSRSRTSRSLPEAHEYVCSCGHRGWSTHRDAATLPLIET